MHLVQRRAVAVRVPFGHGRIEDRSISTRFAPGLGGVLAQELPLPVAEASVEGSWDLGALLGGEFYSSFCLY